MYHITYPMAMARHEEYVRLSHPCVETESQFCMFNAGIEMRNNGNVPMATVKVVSLIGVYRFSSGLDRTV